MKHAWLSSALAISKNYYSKDLTTLIYFINHCYSSSNINQKSPVKAVIYEWKYSIPKLGSEMAPLSILNQDSIRSQHTTLTPLPSRPCLW